MVLLCNRKMAKFTHPMVFALFYFTVGVSSFKDPCKHRVVSEKEVLERIFLNYSKDGRPRKDAHEPVVVTLGFRIMTIRELIERENTLILVGYVLATWYDDYLAWNNSFPLSCVDSVIAPYGSTWLPDLSIVNAANGMFSFMHSSGFQMFISKEGLVAFPPGGQIETQCEIDVTYFPFDSQVCHINFEAWNYDIKGQVFILDPQPFLRVENIWIENRQWHIEANYTKLKNVSYVVPPLYSHVSFRLVLRRKALFYCTNIIAPSAIISVVELATFALPIREVLKVHISFTCLLAYSVFQGMVIADLPRSGDSVPMLSLYIDLQMAYIGLIALMGEGIVFLIIRKAETKSSPPPPKLLFALGLLAKMIFLQHLIPAKIKQTPKTDANKIKDPAGVVFMTSSQPFISLVRYDPKMKEGDRMTKADSNQNLDPDNKLKEAHNQWMFIAEIIDRISLILYASATIITPFAMFYIVSIVSNNDEIIRSKLEDD